MTRSARELAGRARSSAARPLALFLCVLILAVAVDCESATNDTCLRDWTLAWADDDVGDGADAT
jgi:hypothetical protein